MGTAHAVPLAFNLETPTTARGHRLATLKTVIARSFPGHHTEAAHRLAIPPLRIEKADSPPDLAINELPACPGVCHVLRYALPAPDSSNASHASGMPPEAIDMDQAGMWSIR